MVINLFVLSLIIISSSLFLHYAEKNKKIIILYLFLLLSTPWFFILLLAVSRSASTYYCNGQSKNFTCLASFEYIFFQGEKQIHRRLEDYQLLLPSFMPLFILGLYQVLASKNLKQKSLLLAFPALLILGVLKLEKGLIAGLLIAIPASFFSTLGAYSLISNFSRISKIARILSIFLLLWIAYETIRMYQIIIIHKPFIT